MHGSSLWLELVKCKLVSWRRNQIKALSMVRVFKEAAKSLSSLAIVLHCSSLSWLKLSFIKSFL